VKVNPAIAKFRFNVKNEWLDGAHMWAASKKSEKNATKEEQ